MIANCPRPADAPSTGPARPLAFIAALGLGVTLLACETRPARAAGRSLWERLAARAAAAPVPVARGVQLTRPIGPPARQVPLAHVAIGHETRIRLLSSNNAPLKILMVLTRQTLDEVHAMLDVVRRMNEAERPPAAERLRLHLLCESEDVLSHLRVEPGDLSRDLEIDRYFKPVRGDIWAQDWGEVAAIDRGDGEERLVVLDTDRGRSGLAELPAVLARMWNGWYHKLERAADRTVGSGDYGGNIEVTPDDVLILGSTSSVALRRLLARAGYDGRTALLDTNWLRVGHVDEQVATVPDPSTPRGYAIVRADPELGLALVSALPRARLDEEMLELVRKAAVVRRAGAREVPAREAAPWELPAAQRLFGTLYRLHATANSYRLDVHSVLPSPWSDDDLHDPGELIAANRRAGRLIDRNVERLAAVIREASGDDVSPVKVVSLPALFEPFTGNTTGALLPGAANLVALRQHVVVPDPLLPCLRAEMERRLRGTGLVPTFLPAATYHFLDGQIHCGTYVLRHPNRYVVAPGRAARRRDLSARSDAVDRRSPDI
jgi:hypothetical protein